jgi:hypothetical protein
VNEWEVVYHPEFEAWYNSLSSTDKARVLVRVDYLAANGPAARRPIVGKITASRHSNMKELVAPGDIRILFAFDPDSKAVLLVGGAKTNKWKAWYETNIPLADERFDEWLKTRADKDQGRRKPEDRPRSG